MGTGACTEGGQRGMCSEWAEGHVQRVGTGACTEGGHRGMYRGWVKGVDTGKCTETQGAYKG